MYLPPLLIIFAAAVTLWTAELWQHLLHECNSTVPQSCTRTKEDAQTVRHCNTDLARFLINMLVFGQFSEICQI